MYAVVTLGSAALRTLLQVPHGSEGFVTGTKLFHIDTSLDDVHKDAKRNGYTFTDSDGDILLENERYNIEVYIAGDGEGGGMDWEQGRKIIRRELTEDTLLQKLGFLDNTSVCLILGFAGNATGTNLAFVLQKLIARFPKCVFLPVVGLPFREQSTQLKTAMITLKEFRNKKLPGCIVVDNAAFDTFSDLDTINTILAKSFRGLLDMIRNSQLFGFDLADLRRTISDKDFAILGHTKLPGNARNLMENLTNLVKIEQQFSQPNNRGQFAIAGVKAYGESLGDKEIKEQYMLISEFTGEHSRHCKTALWVVPNGKWATEVTVLFGGLPFKAIRPEIEVR